MVGSNATRRRSSGSTSKHLDDILKRVWFFGANSCTNFSKDISGMIVFPRFLKYEYS